MIFNVVSQNYLYLILIDKSVRSISTLRHFLHVYVVKNN